MGSPRLPLIPTTMVDTDTVATTVVTTESVRLRLSPRLPLIPTTMVDTDTEDTTTESVRLRLSPRLLLILTTTVDTIRRIRSEVLRSWIRIRRTLLRKA